MIALIDSSDAIGLFLAVGFICGSILLGAYMIAGAVAGLKDEKKPGVSE